MPRRLSIANGDENSWYIWDGFIITYRKLGTLFETTRYLTTTFTSIITRKFKFLKQNKDTWLVNTFH